MKSGYFETPPPDVRRKVASMKERQRQTTDKRHPIMFDQVHPISRLKSRKSF